MHPPSTVIDTARAPLKSIVATRDDRRARRAFWRRRDEPQRSGQARLRPWCAGGSGATLLPPNVKASASADATHARASGRKAGLLGWLGAIMTCVCSLWHTLGLGRLRGPVWRWSGVCGTFVESPKTALESQCEPFAPIALENREQQRILANSPEDAEARGAGFTPVQGCSRYLGPRTDRSSRRNGPQMDRSASDGWTGGAKDGLLRPSAMPDSGDLAARIRD